MPYCLSLKDGAEIALIKNTDEPIYIKDCEYNSKPEINTTLENKLKIFERFLRRDSKLMKKDIDLLTNYYKQGYAEIETDKPKLNNKFDQALEYVDNSLRRFMNFDNNTYLIPILPKRHWLCFCTGLSGSGKSYYISQLIKNNFPKNQLVYLFSPIEGDEAFEDLNIFQVHLETFEEDFGQSFTIELLKGSKEEPAIVIMDDINTFNNKKVRDMYIEVQNQLLERGRHLNIRTLTVSHNPLSGSFSKAPIRESEFYVLFPSSNYRDSKVLLESYTGLSKQEIEEILNLHTRGLIVKKSVPSYYVSDHNIGILGK
jgi:hypothetical protein